MSGELTSATYDVWVAATTLLQAVTFAAVPEGGGDGPYVWFGDPSQPSLDGGGNPPEPVEAVVVVGHIDSPAMEWGPIGQLAREEVWTFPIVVDTRIPGRSAAQARTRLAELTSAVEQAFRTWHAGSPPAAFSVYSRWQVAVARVNPSILPAEHGYIGSAEITVGCSFRINKPPIV